MQVRLAELARLELEDAREWYDAQQPGLGERFTNEIDASTRRIGRMPLLYAIETGEVRKCPSTAFRMYCATYCATTL